MNWSTRLRRWVRIRTPPVRVASMKPTAATVLPAPVACSNQKRRAAPGSSGASSTTSSSSSAGASSQSCGSSSALLVLVRLPRRRPPRPRRSVLVVVLVAFDVGLVGVGARRRLGLVGSTDFARPRPPRRCGARRRRHLLLGHQLGQGAGERVDLMRVQFGAVAQLRRLVGEEALQPEQQREVAPPLDRGVLGAGVDLGQRGVERLRGGRCRERAPRAPRRRAGTARGRTPPPARYRRY